MTSLEDSVNHPDYRPGMKILVHMIEHVHQVTGEDMKRIAATFVEHGVALLGTKVAVVVSRPVS